jgi:hypothetical protein
MNVPKVSALLCMDLLIEELKKDEGRKQKNDELKAMLKTKEQKLQHIKAMGKLSARLAASNHYVLDDNVLNCLLEIEQSAEAAKTKSKKKQHDLEKKYNEFLQLALKKIVVAPNMLTVAKVKVLVTAAQDKTDSSVQQKKGELMRQLYGVK